MPVNSLKGLAEAYGFRQFKNVMYGTVHNFNVTMHGNTGKKIVCFAAHLDSQEIAKEIQDILSEKSVRKAYLVESCVCNDRRIIVSFIQNRHTLTCIEAFLNWFPDVLNEKNARGADCCNCCGQSFGDVKPKLTLVNGTVLPMHDECAHKVTDILQDADRSEHDSSASVSKGLIGALLGTIAGIIPWAIVAALGYIAGICGFLISWLARIGYEKFGGKKGAAKCCIIIICSVVGVVLGNFCGEVIIAGKELAGMDVSLPIAQLIKFVFDLIKTEPECLSAFIKDCVIGLAFAVMASINLFKEVTDESKGNQIFEILDSVE